MGSTRGTSNGERSRRERRFAVCLGAVLIGLALVPTLASGYGTALPEDETTDHPFGWGAARQVAGGQPEPFVLQYDYDYDLEPEVPGNQRESCNRDDKVDDPISAFTFKNANGARRVQLSFPRAPQNRRMVGRDLRDARRENSPTLAAPDFAASEKRLCGASIMQLGDGRIHDDGTTGAYNWREFDDAEYLQSLYYVPGDPEVFNSGVVYGAMHQEARQTYEKPAYCSLASDTEEDCWFGSITFARSSDLSTCRGVQPQPTTPNVIGACYQRHPDFDPPNPATLDDHLIGTIPYPYFNDWSRHGYAPNSNIISGAGTDPEYSGKHFILANVSPLGTTTQEHGLCLLRTDNLPEPSAWRAWDGDGFDVHPESSENLTGSPEDHLCKPVLQGVQGITIRSLTYNTYLGKYMALGQGQVNGVKGVKYALSDDLRNWSEPQLVVAAPNRTDVVTACDAVADDPPISVPDDGVSYPVVLDPNDQAKDWPTTTNPNFERPGARPDLYFSHMDSIQNVSGQPSQGCHLDEGTDSLGKAWRAANLARLPIDFRPQRQASLDSGVVNPESGFDSTHSNPPTATCGFSGGAYQGSGCASANVFPSYFGSSYGLVSTKWKDSDEVWLGSAFWLPQAFRTIQSGRLLGWHGGPTSSHSLSLAFDGAADQFKLVRRNVSGTDVLDNSEFQQNLVPVDSWAWIELHLKLSSTGGSALSEVYVNGSLVSSSREENMFADTGTITSAVFGPSELAGPPVALTIGIDRATILAGQRGPVGAPPTPVGLRPATGTPKTLTWNSGGGSVTYRVYKLQADGRWGLPAASVSGTSYTDSSCSGTGTYRITSVTNSIESNASSAVELTC